MSKTKLTDMENHMQRPLVVENIIVSWPEWNSSLCFCQDHGCTPGFIFWEAHVTHNLLTNVHYVFCYSMRVHRFVFFSSCLMPMEKKIKRTMIKCPGELIYRKRYSGWAERILNPHKEQLYFTWSWWTNRVYRAERTSRSIPPVGTCTKAENQVQGSMLRLHILVRNSLMIRLNWYGQG